jgi:type II secretory pathway pseudopilin PulG
MRGVTFVALLAILAVIAAGLAAAGEMWHAQAQREREQELLRVGVLYARAIASYRAASPGNRKEFPPSLQALLLDHRFPGTRRHLRRLYGDPMLPGQPWGLVTAADGTIRGVYSRSEAQPWRTEPTDLGVVALPAAQHYNQWQFIPAVAP